MEMRDRLIDILVKHWFDGMTMGECADMLLSNGVIVLPCEVGDTVYYIFEGEIRKLTVMSLSCMFTENINHFNLITTNYRGAVLCYEMRDIGKTVFLNEEEAEKALREREGNG